MSVNNLKQFVTAIENNHAPLTKSLKVTLSEGGDRLAQLAEDILCHYKMLAENDIVFLAKCFAIMVLDLSKLQYQYEMTGKYTAQSFDNVRTSVYNDTEGMKSYMYGLVCSQFAWINHFRLLCFYEDHFLARLKSAETTLEFAPGHGYLGISLLKKFPDGQLTGIDISPVSIEISRQIAKHFGQRHARYVHQDAMNLSDDYADAFNVVICGELLEHVPAPQAILENIHKALRPDGLGYLTAAITAAAPDHIYEFETTSAVIKMVEDAGLTVVDQLCEGTQPMTDGAKGAPRTLAMVIKKR